MIQMRELTFKGFLSKYVKELSDSGTLNISALCKEAVSYNHRLRAPLLLYAAVHQKTALLRSSLKEPGCGGELTVWLDLLESSDPVELLKKGLLPDEFQKVWTSFIARHDIPENETGLKSAMRQKIIQMQRSKNCSNYRLYKDLQLNPGNINSWLKNGDNTKVSYRTAARIVSYLSQY